MQRQRGDTQKQTHTIVILNPVLANVGTLYIFLLGMFLPGQSTMFQHYVSAFTGKKYISQEKSITVSDICHQLSTRKSLPVLPATVPSGSFQWTCKKYLHPISKCSFSWVTISDDRNWGWGRDEYYFVTNRVWQLAQSPHRTNPIGL